MSLNYEDLSECIVIAKKIIISFKLTSIDNSHISLDLDISKFNQICALIRHAPGC